MRRVPQQERSQQRVAAILKAAEQLIAEVGYDRTTTNAIAARAGTAIGSLYQFFPNKEAIGQALVSRYMRQQEELFAKMSAAVLVELAAEELVAQLLEPMVEYYNSHLDLTAIFATAHRSPDLMQDVARFNQELVERLAGLFQLRYPRFSPADCLTYALVVREVGGNLLGLSQAVAANQQVRIVVEAKRLLTAYLRDVESRPP